MNLRLQFGGLILAGWVTLGVSAAMPQEQKDKKPPPPAPARQERPPQRQQPQERSAPPRREAPPAPVQRDAAGGRPPNARPPDARYTPPPMQRNLDGRNVNRPPNARDNASADRNYSNSRGNESGRPPQDTNTNGNRQYVNPNRPPQNNLASSDRYQGQGADRSRQLTPEETQRLQQNQQRFNRLPPQQQQEMRERADVWQRMTEEQRQHVRNDVLPKWQQMPQERRQTIQQKLRILRDMPESARNRRLSDPNFTQGMSDQDRATLRDLSHLHVGGALEPPNE